MPKRSKHSDINRFVVSAEDVIPLYSDQMLDLGREGTPLVSKPEFPWREFQPVAVMRLDETGGRIAVEITSEAAGELTECVYVWGTPDGTALRVGTSSSKVTGRLRQYPRYINKRLDGLNSVTPQWEAERWISLLKEHDHLPAMVYQPRKIDTPAGPLRPYLDVERELIRSFKPALNRSRR